jgi:SAM-dependent methyltransferase
MRFDYKDVNKSKLLNILRYHGLIYLLKRIWYRVVLQPLISAKKERTFCIGGVTYPYFHHAYNTTFINERAIEVPYFREQIASVARQGGRILEIGNVLSHYGMSTWDIVDKFEKGENIINVDIMDYKPPEPFDLIVAISTFEHIGFDEKPQDFKKVVTAINHIREVLLKPSGKLIFSIPTGYNPQIEEHILKARIASDRTILMKRVDWKNNWVEKDKKEEVFGLPYHLFARGLIIVHHRGVE